MQDQTQPHGIERDQRYERTQPVRVPEYYPDELPTRPGYEPVPYEEYPEPAPRGRRGRAKRARRGSFTRRAILVGSVAGLSAFALLGVLIVLGYYAYFQVFELIVPGVYVGEINLSGMSRSEAANTLNTTWNEGERGLIISDGVTNWYAPATDFGMTLDPAATAQRAFDIGHGGTVIAEFTTLMDTTIGGISVPPVVHFDEAQARAGLQAWAPTLNKPPQDASIRIENGEVIPVAGEPGHTLNVDATLAVLAAGPNIALMDGYLPLVLDPVAPRIVDAGAAIAEAKAMLDAPLTIQAYDPIPDQHLEWNATPEMIASWLTVVSQEDGSHAVVDGSRLGGYLQELNASLGQDRYVETDVSAAEIQAALVAERPAVLTVRHSQTSYTVVGGDNLTRIAWKVGIPYWRIVEANPGVDTEALSPGQVLAIPSKDDLLPLPVIPNKRIIVDISDQHLWAYENGTELYSFVISTGIPESPTQPGIFQVQDHDLSVYAPQWDLTMPHFISIYEAWPGFFNGFHGLPTLSSGALLWREVLGRPASFGCIILDLDDGETLYNWAEDGVVVEIRE